MSERTLLGYPIVEASSTKESDLDGITFGDWKALSGHQPCEVCGTPTRTALLQIDKNTAEELRRWVMCTYCMVQMFPEKVNS